MPIDFRDAAERHWEDAVYLHEDNRLANADHLFGISAECSLKAVMQSLGMSIDPMEKQYKVHINKLWNEFITFAENRGGERYSTRIDGYPNPFNDWNIRQRYDNRSAITQNKVENHRQGAEQVREILWTAILDGGVI